MKNLTKIGLAIAALTLTTSLSAQNADFAVVNFRKVIEESKLGKKEQSNFESLKKQVESILEEKEKALNDMASKLQDEDYIDGLSTDAENELKHKFRTSTQELQQLQSQFYQSLNQANVKIVQKMNDQVSQAAKQVAEKKQLAMVVNEDSTFFHKDKLDISSEIVAELDKNYKEEDSK